MNEAHSISMPVLARLPDVSADLPGAPPRPNRSSEAGFIEYRFDPPSGLGDEPAGARQAHVFRRLPHRESPVLPHSELFSDSSASLQQRLAPVVRFLMLFVLFTVAGSMVLMLGQRMASTSEPVGPRPPTSARQLVPMSQQKLEPAPAPGIDPLTVEPSASGPLGAAPPHRRKAEGGSGKAEDPVRLPLSPFPLYEIAVPRVQTNDPAGDDPARSSMVDRRAAARPPAVAYLPGHIQEISSRQAHHDDHQSSLH